MTGAKGLCHVANTWAEARIYVPMSGSDILEQVRRAIQVADTLHETDAALVEPLLRAAERCREATRDFLDVLEQLRPGTLAGEQARMQLQHKLSDLDCGDNLLRSMLESGGAQQSEIHTPTQPSQIQ